MLPGLKTEDSANSLLRARSAFCFIESPNGISPQTNRACPALLRWLVARKAIRLVLADRYLAIMLPQFGDIPIKTCGPLIPGPYGPSGRGLYPRPERRGFTPLLVNTASTSIDSLCSPVGSFCKRQSSSLIHAP